jgi:signal peptidase I
MSKQSKVVSSPVPESRKPSLWYRVRREYLLPFGEAFLLAMVIRTFVIQPFYIPTPSMEPTIHGVKPGGDRIFANKFIYGIRIPFTGKRLFKIRDPKSGDIVVFSTRGIKIGNEKTKVYVKRAVAVGGQTVLIKDGHLFLDGEDSLLHLHTQDQHYYSELDRVGPPMPFATGEPIQVPKGHLFCLGDNSGNSWDGRYWGFVPIDNVFGKVAVRWWPLKRIGIPK